MRIKQINIEKLFGMFDYEIPFNLDERITIIHGKNGMGKTVILNLINDIFNKSFDRVLKTKFKSITITFENNSLLNLKRPSKQTQQDVCLLLSFTDEKEETVALNLPEYFTSKNYDVYIRRKRSEKAHGLISEEDYFLREHRHRFVRDEIREEFQEFQKIEEQLKKIYEAISVNIQLIETQRLTLNSKQDGSSHRVEKYAEELSEEIKKLLLHHSAVSQELDRSVLLRLIENDHKSKINEEEVKQNLNALEVKRSEYVGLGILEEQKDNTSSAIIEKIAPNKLAFLKEYVTDNETKLGIFDALAQKIKLFKELVNKRFSYKQIYFNKEKGFFFKNNLGDEIPLKSLSSGEQHQLILFYDFLFKLKPNALVMIDEPELSLHVEWQRAFLSDYKRITELAKIDLFIATHSPQLINDNRSLMVELEEKTK